MPMTFEEAEARFRQLQARVQRGEPISRAEYEEQVSQLAVQDHNGVLWEINPRTGKWMYFDGAEWVSGTPPGHDTSSVIAMPGATVSPPSAPPPPPPTAPVSSRPSAASPSTPPSKPPASPEAVPPYRRTGQRAPAGRSGEGQTPQQRPSRQNMFAGREWVPLAIGAVVLLLCAVLLYAGGSFAMNLFARPTTPTRIALPTIATTPVPTIVRLPSPTPLPPTPAPVIGKIIEAQVNVRAQPNTRSTILTRLRRDTQITLTAVGPTEGANVWYQINLPDRAEPAWVRSDTLEIVGGDPKTLPPAGGAPATKPPASGPTPTLTPIGSRP